MLFMKLCFLLLLVGITFFIGPIGWGLGIVIGGGFGLLEIAMENTKE